MIKIAVVSRKGGVLKSTISTSLAYGFSKLGRTLLVDLDSQNDSSLYLGINKSDYKKTFDDLFDKKKNIKIEECLIEVRDNLFLLPNSELEAVEGLFYQQSRIDKVLESKFKELESIFDYIIFDTSPTKTKVLDSVFLYVDNLILTIQLQASGVRSIANIYSTLSDLYLDTSLIKAVVPTLYDKTTNDSKENLKTLESFFEGQDLLLSPIPKRTKMAEANKQGKVIFEYDAEASIHMMKVFEGVVKRIV